MSEILQAQAKNIDTMKSELALFQQHTGELIDGIGEKSTEAENLKSEKDRLKTEKDKLNKRCDELMGELEARKLEVRELFVAHVHTSPIYQILSLIVLILYRHKHTRQTLKKSGEIVKLQLEERRKRCRHYRISMSSGLKIWRLN